MNKPVPVSSYRAVLGEGPRWFNDKLYWVDIFQKSLLTYDTSGRQSERTLQWMPGCIAPRKAGGLMVAWEKGFARLDPDTLAHQPVCDPQTGDGTTRFNDGDVDPAGRFWAGTMACNEKSGGGYLYMLDINGRAVPKIPGVSISNGLAWSDDARTMYYIDSMTRGVQAFDFDNATGAISNPRFVIRFEPPVLPDGMTMDTDGNLWIGLWDGHAVVCHDPKSGKLLRRIELPVSQVTACAFGGRDMKTLLITTASTGLSDAQLKEQPLAGSLFAVDVDARGRPARACLC